MPLHISRPTRGPKFTAANVKPKSRELIRDLADLAQGALQSYTPNRWKKLLYQAVSNTGAIPGGIGVGGPVGPTGPLPDPSPAPRGVIAEFLAHHPEFATRNRGKGRHRSFPMAWRHLSREAKETLRDERLTGMYRSGAPSAPYWLIAEGGMEEVGVPARYYLRNSRAAVQRAVPMLASRMLDGL